MTPHPADDDLDQFAARVAHDFNNLLTGILGNLELLEYRAARSGVAGLVEYAQGARSAGARAAAFAQRLMLFSGCGGQVPVPVALAGLLAALQENYQSQGTPFRLTPVPPQAVLRCDPARLTLILSELLDNAFVAAGPGGAVVLELEVAADQLVLTIRDDGPGMAPEILAHATEAFFTTQPSSAGKGLGLAMAARFAAQAGGRLRLESREAAGCTVTLVLPPG